MLYSNARRASPTERTAIRPVRRGVRRLSHRSRRVLAALLVPALVAGLLAAGFALFSDVVGRVQPASPRHLHRLREYERRELAGECHRAAASLRHGLPRWHLLVDHGVERGQRSGGVERLGLFHDLLSPDAPELRSHAGRRRVPGTTTPTTSRSRKGSSPTTRRAPSCVSGGSSTGNWMPWYASSSERVRVRLVLASGRHRHALRLGSRLPVRVVSQRRRSRRRQHGRLTTPATRTSTSWPRTSTTRPGEPTRGARRSSPTSRPRTYGLNWLTSFAAQQGKPVALGEWGLGAGTGQRRAGRTRRATQQVPEATTRPSSTTWRSGS